MARITKVRKLFTNKEILAALDEAGDGVGSHKVAAKLLTSLGRGSVSRQLVRYWERTLTEFTKKDGTPYSSTGATDRKIREEEVKIRPASPTDYTGTKKVVHDNSSILVIPDLHAPYQHPDAIDFLIEVAAKHQPTRVINLGDECFPAGTEVMTEIGWVKFGELPEDLKIMQVHEGGQGELVERERSIHKVGSFDILERKHRLITQRTTPNHLLVKVSKTTGKWHKREAWDDVGSGSWYIPRHITFAGDAWGLTDEQLRFLVAFQADGTFTKGAVRFGFSKERKAIRLTELMDSLQIPYTQHKIERGDFQYYIKVQDVPEYLSKLFSDKLSATGGTTEQRELFLRELEYWDGTPTSCGIRYSSFVDGNLDFVQAVAATSGYYVSKGGHFVEISWDRTEETSLRTAAERTYTVDEVFCVTVPTGMILIREEGHVSVIGNCDSHGLSFHDSDPNLDSAGVELHKARKFLHKLHSVFPKMEICHSNHGSLIYRRAFKFGIPVEMIKTYREILFPKGDGEGWTWHENIRFNLPNGQAIQFQHQSVGDYLQNAAHERCNLVLGHEHGKFQIEHRASKEALYWGMYSGCLIDSSSMAFAYGKLFARKPIIGCSVIIDSQPILIPMLLDTNGRWVGKLGGVSNR